MKLSILSCLAGSAFLFALGSNPANAGVEAHGGDAYSLEFVAYGQAIVRTIEKLRPPELQTINLELLKAKVASARVESKSKLSLDDAEVDAINYADEVRIEMSRSRWDELGGNIVRKVGVVFHEYLGLLRVDRKYEFSPSLIAAIKAGFLDLPVRLECTFRVKEESLNKRSSILSSHWTDDYIPNARGLSSMNALDEQVRSLGSGWMNYVGTARGFEARVFHSGTVFHSKIEIRISAHGQEEVTKIKFGANLGDGFSVSVPIAVEVSEDRTTRVRLTGLSIGCLAVLIH